MPQDDPKANLPPGTKTLGSKITTEDAETLGNIPKEEDDDDDDEDGDVDENKPVN